MVIKLVTEPWLLFLNRTATKYKFYGQKSRCQAIYNSKSFSWQRGVNPTNIFNLMEVTFLEAAPINNKEITVNL